MKIPFSPPRIDQKTIDEVTNTLRSGWITTGPKTKLFEKRLAEYCGNPRTLCVSSATAGLELMLRWFGVGPGDEVIIPAYTYAATANVVEHCGAAAVMVDSTDEFNIDVEAVRKAINARTKVIIPVDIGGLPCDYDALNALIRDEEIKANFKAKGDVQEKLGRILLLADAAHSVGALYKGKISGSLADISVFSFHAVKNLTTAEGGAICLNLPEAFDHEELYKYLAVFSLHGQNKDALSKMKGTSWRYDIIEPGYKCNMTDIQAAIGLVELERYEDMLARRKAIFERYAFCLQDYKWAEIPLFADDDRISSFHVFLLRVKGISEEGRDRIMKRVMDSGVSVNVHFVPLPMMSYYKGKGYSIDNYPVAFDNYSREISLPVYYDLTDEMVDIVCAEMIQAVEAEMEAQA